MFTYAAAAVDMTTAIGNITSVIPTVIGVIEENAVMMTYFCAGILAIGIRVVKKLVGRY